MSDCVFMAIKQPSHVATDHSLTRRAGVPAGGPDLRALFLAGQALPRAGGEKERV